MAKRLIRAVVAVAFVAAAAVGFVNSAEGTGSSAPTSGVAAVSNDPGWHVQADPGWSVAPQTASSPSDPGWS